MPIVNRLVILLLCSINGAYAQNEREVIYQVDTANQYLKYSKKVYKESEKQLLVEILIEKSDSIGGYFVVKDTVNFASIYPAKECSYKPYSISKSQIRFLWSDPKIFSEKKISLAYRLNTKKKLKNIILYGSVKYTVLKIPDEFKVLIKL